MAVISLRLNQNEEDMVNFLSEYYEQDKSSLIKYSLKELYEDIIDKRIISEYETKEKNGEINFIDSNEIMNMLKTKARRGDSHHFGKNIFPCFL
jgi:Arc/MetJ-type ribon-helix-helix transcriptional regulator